MGLTITDEATVAAINRLADRTGRSAEDVVRSAVARAVQSLVGSETHPPTEKTGTVSPEVRERRVAAMRELQAEVASWPKTGLKADKAFFDSLNDDL